MDREDRFIETAKEDFYLPDDVVSLLYQENTSLLQKINSV